MTRYYEQLVQLSGDERVKIVSSAFVESSNVDSMHLIYTKSVENIDGTE